MHKKRAKSINLAIINYTRQCQPLNYSAVIVIYIIQSSSNTFTLTFSDFNGSAVGRTCNFFTLLVFKNYLSLTKLS